MVIRFGFAFRGLTRFYDCKIEAIKLARFCGLTEDDVFESHFARK